MSLFYEGKIFHKRFFPVVNSFTYSAYFIKFSLKHLESLNVPLFSVDRFNVFSFYKKDHGHKDHRSLESWAIDLLKDYGMDFKGEIILQTFPRVFGHVFNPVSFWYCLENGETKAIIAEVNNTFGENHNYIIDPKQNSKQLIKKQFHVSPFYDVKGYYEFEFRDHLVVINYYFDDKLQLATSISGYPVGMSFSEQLKRFLKNPFFSFFVVVLIHYQALKLFIKKVKFYTKPEPPKDEVTYEIPKTSC